MVVNYTFQHPAEKAEFKKAAEPVYTWFKQNIKNGPTVFNALTKAVEKAEAKIDAAHNADIK